MKAVTIYSDGACRGNPGPGGWGALLSYGEHERELFGGERNTTNNRMELTAAIVALETLREGCHIQMFTDSEYVRRGITEWLPGWKARGWRTSGRQPVKNADLWQRLETACGRHRIEWHWVKGHSGDAGNERADQLANKGVDEVLKS